MAERELAILVVARGIQKATGQILTLDRRLQHLGKASRNVSQNIQRGVVLAAGAAAAGIGYAVNAAVEWESAFAGVNKTVEGTPEQLQAINDGLRDMARELPISAVELAAIAENAGALGIETPDILAFTRTIALIGTTTNVSTDEAATALGQLRNVIGLTADDFDNFGASLVALGNDGESTEAQILEIARRAGATAKLFGIAKDETLGWAAAAANLGMEQELAGTSLQRMFIALMPAYIKGSKDLQSITGQTAKQLKQSFQVDASGAVETLVQKIGSMPKDARLAAVQKLFGKGTGLTRLVLGLADSYEKNLVPSLDLATDSWAENTAMTEEAAKRFKTTQSALTVFKNNVRDAAITVGSELLPQLAELAKEGADWLRGHQPEIKQFAKDLAQGFRDAVTWLKGLDWDAIKGALGSAAGFAKTMVEWFMKLPAPIQQFLAVGFAANKFTGGVIGDVLGDVAKGFIKGILGINAGVVNVRGAVVNGGGLPGGAPAAAGAGLGLGGIAAALGAALIPVAAAGIVMEISKDPRIKALTEAGRQATIDARGIVVPTTSGKSGGLSPDEREEHNESQRKLDLLDDRLQATREAAQRTKAAVDLNRINTVAATRTGDASIVAAIRGIMRPIVNVNVSSTTVRVRSYSTGTTLNRYAGKLVPI